MARREKRETTPSNSLFPHLNTPNRLMSLDAAFAPSRCDSFQPNREKERETQREREREREWDWQKGERQRDRGSEGEKRNDPYDDARGRPSASPLNYAHARALSLFLLNSFALLALCFFSFFCVSFWVVSFVLPMQNNNITFILLCLFFFPLSVF